MNAGRSGSAMGDTGTTSTSRPGLGGRSVEADRSIITGGSDTTFRCVRLNRRIEYEWEGWIEGWGVVVRGQDERG